MVEKIKSNLLAGIATIVPLALTVYVIQVTLEITIWLGGTVAEPLERFVNVTFPGFGIISSIVGLLIVYTATTLPVAIYMLQGYFKSIPKEIEDAGIMDGQNWFGIILKIIIPLSLPAIASVALYVFMIAWNEFLFSLMFLDSPKSFTLSRAIQYLSGDAETPRQYLMAGSVIVTLPVLFIFIYFEKYLVSGLTAGSVKE